MSAAPPAAQAQLRTWLQSLSLVPDAEFARFASKHITAAQYEKGSFFTRSGDATDRVGYVVRGLFRVYYTGPDGSFHVRNFCPEGSPLGSYVTVLAEQPAHVDIEALEDSLVLQFPYRALAAELQTSAAWERLGRRIAEQHYVSRERREWTLLTQNAAGRLRQFERDFGGLAHRLSQTDIASYIGVRRETLSRLKRKR
ncbi:MAG: Crp/Fnr family transcriptional regulator [Archangiaceae bacterium]|nr:Crp/Fnr family transcriptional regulator [Archangiaceae bacterium]